ncbi:MAG: hypothetical protein JWN67_1716 [Actinomycetia bacterium]|nr:hypothetical protein [Actinomycetes bacterium]
MRISLRTKLVASALGGLALTALATGPALAAGDTTTTFTLTGAGLGVSVPATANLSASTNIGVTSLSSQLGAIQVADNRGSLLAAWTATVSSTDFTTGAAGAHEKVTKGNVSYSSGLATASTGLGVDVPSLAPMSLSSSQTAFAHTGVIGSQSTTWNPTVAVTVPADAVAGTYTGTITHSVA